MIEYTLWFLLALDVAAILWLLWEEYHEQTNPDWWQFVEQAERREAQHPIPFRTIGPTSGGWRDTGFTDTRDAGITITRNDT